MAVSGFHASNCVHSSGGDDESNAQLQIIEDKVLGVSTTLRKQLADNKASIGKSGTQNACLAKKC